MVRYFNPNIKGAGEFGEGWHLLIPYRIKPADKDKITYENVILPKRMAVENLLTGAREILEFSEDRYSIVGYVPEVLKKSQVLGLFLMTDVSYRLVDKIGNEFHFDQAGYLTDMFLGNDNHVHYEYNDGFLNEFEKGPYQLHQVGEKRSDFANVSIPKMMELKDEKNSTDEVFVFRQKWGFGAYIPEHSQKSKYRKMALMTDGSFQLIDKKKNEIAFDPSGFFDGIATNPEQFRVIRSMTQGTQKVTFKYELDKDNSVRISKSYLLNTEEKSEPELIAQYLYDDEGRLAKVDRAMDMLVVK